jgi:hypothetical protein
MDVHISPLQAGRFIYEWTSAKMDIRPIFFKEIRFTISLENLVNRHWPSRRSAEAGDLEFVKQGDCTRSYFPIRTSVR